MGPRDGGQHGRRTRLCLLLLPPAAASAAAAPAPAVAGATLLLLQLQWLLLSESPLDQGNMFTFWMHEGSSNERCPCLLLLAKSKILKKLRLLRVHRRYCYCQHGSGGGDDYVRFAATSVTTTTAIISTLFSEAA